MRNCRICDLFPALQQQHHKKVINFPNLENAHFLALLQGLTINEWLSANELQNEKKIVFCVITLKIDSKEFIGPKAAKRKIIPN